MEKIFVAKRVAKKLYETEVAIDGAMVDTSELLADFLKARQELKLSTVFADEVQVKLMEAMKALSEAQTAMVAAHAELNDAKLRLGIRTKMEFVAKPRPTGASDSEVTLREVG